MRRPLLPAALVLLLAACSVGVEGAPCQTDANCPEGQGCEYAGRCSKAAAACGPICREDACGAGGAQACVPDASRVCASLSTPLACGPSAACGVVAGTAECIAASIQAPLAGTPVGASVTVTAALTFGAGAVVAPATVQLRAGGVAAGTLSRTALAGQVATYSGTWTPAASLESDVSLTVAVGSVPPVESPPRTVNVDTKPPVVSAATATCPQSPCLRDDVLTVTTSVTDASPVTVLVSLSLDSFSLSAPAVAGAAQLALRDWPLRGLSDVLVARVTATDDRGNVSTRDAPVTGGVTRVRSELGSATGAAATSPAIDAAGTAIFGTATTTGQLHGVRPDGSAAWTPTTLEVTAGAGLAVLAAPAVGAVDLFVGSEDGRIYRVLPTGALPISTPRWPTSTTFSTVPAASLFTPTIVSPLGVDHAYTAGGWARLHQFYSDETGASLLVPEAAYAAGVISAGTPIYATSNGSAATLRRFADIAAAPTPSDSIPLTDGGSPPVACDRVSVPLAVDGAGNVVAACDNGQLHRVTTAAGLGDQLLYKLPAGTKPTGSPVVDRDGAILLPASDGAIWKLVPGASAGSVAWTVQVGGITGEFPTGVAAVSPVASVGGPDYVATTSQGRVAALDLMGNVKWSAILPGAPGSLGFPTIASVPPPGSAYALPTLLAGSSSGKVVRVIVDGDLDSRAPWPKAHHDLRNTGNHGAPLP